MIDDEQIIALFFARSESAVTELDTKYGKTFHNLSYNILNNRQDAEECVNDAYLGTWNAIPPAHPNPLLTFVSKIVRNLSIMRYHANTAMKRNSTYDVALSEVEHCLSAVPDVEQEMDVRVLSAAIETFLDTLTAENRVIFMRRYWFADTYAQIAERIGISEKDVSVRLARTRRQLHDYLLKEGVLV